MLWVLIRSASSRRGASNEYPQYMFSTRNKKNIDTFGWKKAPYQELCSCAVWSESGVTTWQNFASLAIQNVHSEDSDQTVQM